jgi:hypothetical protein
MKLTTTQLQVLKEMKAGAVLKKSRISDGFYWHKPGATAGWYVRVAAKALVNHGLIETVPSSNGNENKYCLTQKGIEATQ